MNDCSEISNLKPLSDCAKPIDSQIKKIEIRLSQEQLRFIKLLIKNGFEVKTISFEIDRDIPFAETMTFTYKCPGIEGSFKCKLASLV